MRNAMISLLALVLAAGCAGKASQKAKYRVSAYLLGTEAADPFIIGSAKSLVTRMFAAIDISLRWEAGVPPKAGCPAGANAEIIVRLAPDAPANFQPDRPAYSLPYASYGERVTVFYDRAVIPLRPNPMIAAIYLGHVMAHEITHVLEGSKWHSEEGLMQSQWTVEVLARMKSGPLRFAPSDVQLLRQGIERGGCTKATLAPRASAERPN